MNVLCFYSLALPLFLVLHAAAAVAADSYDLFIVATPRKCAKKQEENY
jgi:hypothetical protein